MVDTLVKTFNSSMTGAPTLNNSNGTLVAVLDACLVDGFGTVTINSLVVSGDVATATVSLGHGLGMTGATGPVITIAGADQSSLNGVWRVSSVPSSTTFSFATPGVSNQSATGTITAKRTPAGWSKAFSGTNKAAYRSVSVGATGFYFRVQDDAAAPATSQQGVCAGYESMSDVDTGTGRFPASGTPIISKYRQTSPGTPRVWRVFADDRSVWLLVYCVSDVRSYWEKTFFGDAVSVITGDAFHCLLAAADANAAYRSPLDIMDGTTTYGHFHFSRGYTQTGAAVRASLYGPRLNGAYIGNGGYGYPLAGANSAIFEPPHLIEASPVAFRGFLPGYHAPIHSANPPDGTIIDIGAGPLAGRTVVAQSMYTGGGYDYRAAFDITGPWR